VHYFLQRCTIWDICSGLVLNGCPAVTCMRQLPRPCARAGRCWQWLLAGQPRERRGCWMK